MVGKKRIRVSIASLTAQFIDKPFRPGGRGPDAYDCLGLCYGFMAALGKADKFPDHFGEWTWENYHELFLQDREVADRTLMDAFDVIGDPVAPTSVLAGDLIIVTVAGRTFPAIYAGCQNAITTWNDRGVRVFKVESKHVKIMKARRL